MKIRKASKKDIKEIAKLMMKAFSKPPFNEKVSIKAVLKSLGFYLRIGSAFVAEENTKVIGVLVFNIKQYWEGPVLIVEDLAVSKKYQNKRIGTRLMMCVENYAKKKKITAIYLATNIKSPAVKFYQKKGYKLFKQKVFLGKTLK